MSKMPAQRPGKSDSTFQTPENFLRAVRNHWGIERFASDLATTEENNTGALHVFTPEQDALTQDWTRLTGDLWLNPPYSRIEPWARKCAESTGPQRRIFLLVPASVGANWYQRYVHNVARVYFLSGRLTFVGHTTCYIKDCILAVYGEPPGYEPWRWTEGA
jgi:phage N-6-adenine-methyltransferase